MNNEGFFNSDETKSSTITRIKKRRLHKTPNCSSCQLYKTCKSPKMKATGEGIVSILFIAEAPGKREDEEGEQLVGKAGQLMRRIASRLGVNIDDCRKINAINCRPPNNRTPTPKEIDHCRPMVWNEIRESKPKVIILLGNAAIQSFLSHRWPKDLGGVGKWRGWCIPDRDAKAWVCPTYHPSFILRHTTDDVAEVIFRSDLKKAFGKVYKKFQKNKSEAKKVTISKGEKHTIRYLKKLNKSSSDIAFDYETTGKKPQAAGHEIVSCAISENKDHAFAFGLTDKIIPFLVAILINKRIGKIAANLKFEELWTRQILKCKVENWKWDTVIASHVLDNREGVNGVKFQAYVHFGLLDYSSHLDPYLKSGDQKNANSINRIHEVDMKDLLLYNGIDAMIEYRLAKKQMKLIDHESK